MDFLDRLKHAWNTFMYEDMKKHRYEPIGFGYSQRPDRNRMSGSLVRSIVLPIYNRLAIDAASMIIRHVKVDEDDQYVDNIKSSLNDCLNLSANTDQTGRAMIQDVVMSMFDEGCVAIVPTDTSFDPSISNSYDILSLRVGQVVEWYPKHIKVKVYDENDGQKKDVVMLKKDVCIIENPLYAIMNEQNGTVQRLINKLNLLDAVDNQSSSGKLDLLIQLPYVLKTEARKEAANIRRQEIEQQLTGSKYGIAYVDGTEKVTQLNRPVENNLLNQVTYLTEMVHDQLGLTKAILDGTADEKSLLNYFNRTIEPIIGAIVDEMKRKFLTKTARSQYQSIRAFRDPFKLVPVNDLAEIADKFTRNEIFSSNNVRSIVGLKPSKQEGADELRNKNLNKVDQNKEVVK